jgi:hypothetical protein
MELIIMSLGGTLVALSLQLSELLRDRVAFAAIQSVLALAEHVGLWPGPIRAARRLAWVVAATALLQGLGPGRAAASALPTRLGESNEAIAAGSAHAEEPRTPVASQYFDTAEGAHTTEVVEVRAARIPSREGADARVPADNRTLTGQRSGASARLIRLDQTASAGH